MVVFEIKELILVIPIETRVLGEEEIVGLRLHKDVGRHGDGERVRGNER